MFSWSSRQDSLVLIRALSPHGVDPVDDRAPARRPGRDDPYARGHRLAVAEHSLQAPQRLRPDAQARVARFARRQRARYGDERDDRAAAPGGGRQRAGEQDLAAAFATQL